MWIIFIIFLIVGYGDMYFVSVCGCCVFVMIGFMGIGIIVLLIIVIL